MPMHPELNSCPFCRANDQEELDFEVDRHSEDLTFYRATCSCGAAGPWKEKRADARIAWNAVEDTSWLAARGHARR